MVGVQERLGSAFGRDQDNSIYIPVSAFDRLYGPGTGFALFGRPRPGSGLTSAGRRSMKRAWRCARAFTRRPGEDDNFDTLTPDAIRGFIDQVLGMIAAVVVPVTCISLVVGGIVIMNIMLVSVTERTREIGIRKALGARHGDVMLQILIEAVVLASHGRRHGSGGGRRCYRCCWAASSTFRCTSRRGTWCWRWAFRAWWGWFRAGIRRRARRSSIRWWRCARSDDHEHQRRRKTSRMAMQAVWTHRFRSLLTILGIVIGITTVVTVASLLTGLRQGVVVFFQELGPDNIFLYKTSGDPSHGRSLPRSASGAR